MSLAWCLVAAAVLVSGCGGAQNESAPARPVKAELVPQDQTLSARSIEIQGIAFAPEALGLPAMPQVTPRGKPALDRQRAKVARPKVLARDVQVLVTMLWDEAGRAGGDPVEVRELREEARTALRKLHAQSAGKADALSLHMLAAAEMWLADDAAASAAFEELLARFPQEDVRGGLRVWLASAYLRQRRVKDAVALVREWKIEEQSELGAYAVAWVAFLGGEAERARRAIATAAARWKDDVSRPAVERDLVLILARSGAEVAEASRLVAEAAGGDAQRRYVWMFKLSESYKYAGNYEAAARALDVIVDEVVKGPMPADDLVGFRYRQADYAFRLDRPREAAERAMQAQKALAACAEKCPPDNAQAVMERILKLAQFSHTVYAKSLDGEHYDAAVALYQHYIALPGRPDTDAARGYLSSLQETKASADPAAGRHDQDVLLNYFWARRETVAACYEGALLTQPALDGSLELTIEIDARGEVSGATSKPAAGAEGMPAVAGCVVERARTWKFPSRTVPGKTTLTAPLAFRRQAPEAAAPESTPPG